MHISGPEQIFKVFPLMRFSIARKCPCKICSYVETKMLSWKKIFLRQFVEVKPSIFPRSTRNATKSIEFDKKIFLELLRTSLNEILFQQYESHIQIWSKIQRNIRGENKIFGGKFLPEKKLTVFLASTFLREQKRQRNFVLNLCLKEPNFSKDCIYSYFSNKCPLVMG